MSGRQESYLIVHACLRSVSSQVFSTLGCFAPVWRPSAHAHVGLLDSIGFAVRKGCVRVSSVDWDTEERLVPCVCYTRFFTEWTAL